MVPLITLSILCIFQNYKLKLEKSVWLLICCLQSVCFQNLSLNESKHQFSHFSNTPQHASNSLNEKISHPVPRIGGLQSWHAKCLRAMYFLLISLIAKPLKQMVFFCLGHYGIGMIVQFWLWKEPCFVNTSRILISFFISVFKFKIMGLYFCCA